MAFARHNIEKRRLIELVRLNPILWDCRLPHYKRSDKKKAIKWNELGRIFNVNGERVQRTFTSLREIFRRELNHEKLLGNRFKSKWEYYEAMAFLREVIRERKSRERIKPNGIQTTQSKQQPHNNNNNHNSNNNNNSNNGIDEYQYFAPNDPNNPNNQATNAQQQSLQLPPVAAQALPATPQPQQLQQQQPLHEQQRLQTLQLQQDVILSLNTNTLNALQKLSTNGGLPPREQSPHALSSTHSGSSSPSIYIKDEPDSQDDTISLASMQHYEFSNSPKAPRSAKINKNAYHSRRKLISSTRQNANNNIAKSKTLHSSSRNLIIDEQLHEADVDDDAELNGLEDVDEAHMSNASTITMAKHRPSAREILYTKFGDFLAARLNTLHETVANDLMNKILLLIAEK